MDISTIGTILKKRIKEQGYTQEEFADECGIGLSTLQKYMRGERMYKYDLLEVFADKLNCTYDYLLGKSEVPEKEYQDMRNETGLSICAIDELKEYKRIKKIDVLNYLLENRKFMEILILYIDMPLELRSFFSTYVENSMQIAKLDEHDTRVGMMMDIDFNFRHNILLELELMKQEYEKKK